MKGINILIIFSILFLFSCTKRIEKKDILITKKIENKKEVLITKEFKELSILCKSGEQQVCKYLKKRVEEKIIKNNIKFDTPLEDINNPIKIWELGFLLRYRYISESISTNYFKKACNLYEGEACRELGLIYYYADFGQQDLKLAELYFDQGCKLKDGNSCSYLGKLFFFRGEEYSKIRYYFDLGCRYKDSLGCTSLENFFKITKEKSNGEYYKKACEYNDTFGCYNYIEMVYKDKIMLNSESLNKSISIIEKNCNYNASTSCTKLGALYSDFNKIITSDSTKAEKYLEKACNLDDMEGCNNLAYYINEKRDQDYKKAYENLYKSCTMGFPIACIHIGFYHIQGIESIIQNLKYGFSYHKKACDLSNKLCFKLGNYYAKKHIPEAKELYKKGCNYKNGNACYGLGNLYEDEKNISDANFFYNKSMIFLFDECKKNNLDSCLTLGYAYYSGKGAKKDLSKAKNYYQKSCKLGDKQACYFISRF